MRYRLSTFGALLVVTVVLPMKTTACGSTACITVTPADLVNGACPTEEAALARFTSDSSDCNPGAVTNVEGQGTLGEGLCCYPVSMNAAGSESPGCGLAAVASAAVSGGTGGSFANGGSIGSSSIGGSGATGGAGQGGAGQGGTGGVAACMGSQATLTCAAALAGEVPFAQVCGQRATFLSELRVCGCTMSCATACQQTLCVGNAPDDGCTACLDMSCAAPLASCQSN